jgi:hypothetical protein
MNHNTQDNQELGLLVDNLRYHLGAEAVGNEYSFYERDKAINLIEAYVTTRVKEAQEASIKKTLAIVSRRLMGGGYSKAADYLKFLEHHSDYLRELGFTVEDGTTSEIKSLTTTTNGKEGSDE